MLAPFYSFLASISKALSAYFPEMSLMVMATLLVIYGDVINGHLKRLFAPYHFVIRTTLFVLVCAFGYGALTLYGAPLVLHIIKFLPWMWQGIGFIVVFIALGIMAERRRYM
ncbi:DUF3392 domain-containing protein [Alteromonas ponticola]|uniref:DUF3392 domain-containing protein n=1 Tax=Alteromonas aquimaris TaxID=2998417 RepID=A0ABT3P8Q4_9ALTE|nr:DUF3392 family protein [Alteromonas aquimaris]MCW8109147.1 DUF3392 domain-containing protein [Alteromonas aquimaris]